MFMFCFFKKSLNILSVKPQQCKAEAKTTLFFRGEKEYVGETA